ncbi:Chaperone-dependent E3 ubiquitin protein ligase (contains TPR repeats) [Handroanthus impetiginosus]|uniref:RING-type E3 ubiquitin transferase n=1 Tax=Handroanthus impetiginosus TaxID=429701 RepID=A0A2G9HV59_9LAMI|nr:Chaperone-dependent E3 ubiquitin protein ligase (contains TPR repeats) [Handroanthus impetiginosus]
MENHMASESLLDTSNSISEVVDIARDVPIQTDNFKKFSSFLDRIASFVQELSKFEVKNFEIINKALENLKVEIEFAKQLVLDCKNRNKIYLFVSCKRIVEDLDNCTKNISRVLSIFASGSLDVPAERNEWLMNLCKNMPDVKYHVSEVEEEILQKIETGLVDRNNDRSFASDLLVRIAESVGIELSERKTEFENFKDEMERIESRTDASRMEQIVLLLSNADILTTPKEKEMKYFTKRNSLGRKLLEPLPSFYCPITADVMVDPVETSSGHTFERAAIEKWLSDGNNLCPLTKTPLSRSSLRPNKTLGQSIEEWKNRNTMISITSMKPEIQSSDEEEVLCSIEKLRGLCERSELHREWIVMEEYIPIITGLLSAKKREVRVHSLAILYSLAKDSEDNKERIAKVNDSSITYIVRSLARRVDESMLSLQLLLELSRSNGVREMIGRAQGCILLLVTLASSDDAEASEYAREVLDNLAAIDENVIQMARAKFFKPLLQRLCEGPVDVQTIMAETLADIELTDHNKLCLSSEGALKPLLQMLHNSDIEVKGVAVKAIEHLLGVAPNGLQLIKEGAKDPLFELLFCHTLSSRKLREHAAKSIMHLAVSTTSPEASEGQISLLETQEDIFKLFSLISYVAVDMQEILLLAFHAMCKSPSGLNIRSYLRQISAVKVLIQLCELDELVVRANAVKLFYYLTEDGDHATFSEHVNKKCITCLLKIIKTSDNEDETAAAFGIISHLPQNPQISENLLECGTLEVIFDCLTSRNVHSSQENTIVESASKALCRFTLPSHIEIQKRVAEAGMIPILVKLLESGSPLTKRNAAISLKQFSESSRELSVPVRRSHILGCCMRSPEPKCPVHSGICTIESSFCLLEAKAVRPLVVVLEEPDDEACKASLDAILTLIDGLQLQSGCKILEEAGAVPPIIKFLNSSCVDLQEKALRALQRIFRMIEYKTKHGKSAQTLLVDITQRGSRDTKSLAAKILAQLNVLNEQSSFFSGAV